MFSFSTCWNSHRHTDGRAMLNEIRELGFDYAELGHGIRLSLYDGILQAVAANEIKISSVHNFCPLPVGVMGPAPDYYMPSSRDETERALAVRHTLRSIECAATTGARALVLHLGMVSMRDYTSRLLGLQARQKTDSWRYRRLHARALAVRARRGQRFFDAVCLCLDQIVPQARDAGIKLGIETRFRLEEIPSEEETAELIGRYGADTVGYWHDVAHAMVKEQLGLHQTETILTRFRGQTAGIHLQDFAPPAEDHLPPGKGSFDFARLKPYITPEMILGWEIHPRWPAEDIVDATRTAQATLQEP